MKYNRLLLLALLIFSTNLFAQTIYLRSGSIQPAENIRKETVDSFNVNAKRISGQAFAVIQFSHIPTAAEQKQLLSYGVNLLEYLPQNTYRVSLAGNVSFTDLQSAGARSIFQLSAQQKMQEYLLIRGQIIMELH